MNKRQVAHLAALLAAAIIARYILYPYVGVWGDAGLYYYDAWLINQGLDPYIDFAGRSPLFNYAYAMVAAQFGNTIGTLRAFIGFWWILAGVPTYFIGRRIHSHLAGLVSFSLLELTPFMLVYGFWANTQSMAAFFGITAIAVIIYREGLKEFAIAGSLLGLAFLSRRSLVVVLFAIWLYAVYLQYRSKQTGLLQNVSIPLYRSGVSGAAFLFTIFGWYLVHASFDITTAIKLFHTHFTNLFISYGRGGFPLINVDYAPQVKRQIETGSIPIFHDVCKMCGTWTARTFAKTMIVTVPLIGPLFVYWRDWVNRWFSQRQFQYSHGILLALTLYAITTALLAGYYTRVGAVVSLAAFAFVVFDSKAVSSDWLYNKHSVLLMLVLLGLTGGYLYRNRIIHTYYFADFVPFLSALVGMLYVEIWEGLTHE
jgi:hypothetical protein